MVRTRRVAAELLTHYILQLLEFSFHLYCLAVSIRALKCIKLCAQLAVWNCNVWFVRSAQLAGKKTRASMTCMAVTIRLTERTMHFSLEVMTSLLLRACHPHRKLSSTRHEARCQTKRRKKEKMTTTVSTTLRNRLVSRHSRMMTSVEPLKFKPFGALPSIRISIGCLASQTDREASLLALSSNSGTG